MAMRTITGLFDNRAEADRTAEDLARLGIGRDRIQIHAQQETGSAAPRQEETGFWASLRDLFLPEEDAYAYSEGIRRGGFLLTAQVDDAQAPRAMDAFEAHGAVDIDARMAEWKREGWSGYQGMATGSAAGRAMPHQQKQGKEEAIPVVEEQLHVGKRDVESGRVRVRSYVVETPVQEQVTLRGEHVDVQRRAVDRPTSSTDDAAFRERTVEARETSQEPVVSKDARVKEEVVVRKQADEHTETVSDKVRRTKVEVDDERRARPGAPDRGTSGPGRNPGRGGAA